MSTSLHGTPLPLLLAGASPGLMHQRFLAPSPKCSPCGTRLSQSGSRASAWRMPLTVAMGLRAVESFDTSFELNPEAQETLVALLTSDMFLEQVATQPGAPEGCRVKFTENLFQPVPWSPATRHGMPEEYEKFLHDKENFLIINVPPNFMFKAQIFKPSRLCAIYEIIKQE